VTCQNVTCELPAMPHRGDIRLRRPEPVSGGRRTGSCPLLDKNYVTVRLTRLASGGLTAMMEEVNLLPDRPARRLWPHTSC
jgi:hypothetical protein